LRARAGVGVRAGAGAALFGSKPLKSGEIHLLSLTKGGFYASRD
jgi:hypothetical protein